jgi:hypothetical protein
MAVMLVFERRAGMKKFVMGVVLTLLLVLSVAAARGDVILLGNGQTQALACEFEGATITTFSNAQDDFISVTCVNVFGTP